MIYNLINVFLLILVLLTHELGHYFEMIENDIRVKELSIGIGPRIFYKRFKNGIFSVRLIPIAAFVTPEKEFNIKKERNKNRLNKYLKICFAGINVNFVLGVIAFAICFIIARLNLEIMYDSPWFWVIYCLENFWIISLAMGVLNFLPIIVTDGAKCLRVLLKLVYKNELLISILWLIGNITGILAIWLLFKMKILYFIF